MNRFVDAIIFIPTFSELVTYLDANAPETLARDEDGNLQHPPNVVAFSRTPAVISGEKMLTYCRFTDEQVTQWRNTPGVEVLAEATYFGKETSQIVYDALFADTEATAKYDSVYDRTPKTVDDGEGGTMTVNPPDKFGVMA